MELETVVIGLSGINLEPIKRNADSMEPADRLAYLRNIDRECRRLIERDGCAGWGLDFISREETDYWQELVSCIDHFTEDARKSNGTTQVSENGRDGALKEGSPIRQARRVQIPLQFLVQAREELRIDIETTRRLLLDRKLTIHGGMGGRPRKDSPAPMRWMGTKRELLRLFKLLQDAGLVEPVPDESPENIVSHFTGRNHRSFRARRGGSQPSIGQERLPGKAITWIGTRRQLVQLFRRLKIEGWIDQETFDAADKHCGNHFVNAEGRAYKHRGIRGVESRKTGSGNSRHARQKMQKIGKVVEAIGKAPGQEGVSR